MEKLYVLIRNDLKSASYKAVQAGHAVAQYILEHPDQTWNNHTLVYLTVKNEYSLKMWEKKLDKYSKFYEPDINNEMTAIACQDKEELFKNLDLLKD